VIQRWSFGIALSATALSATLAACGGRAPGQAQPAASARETVTAFMRAVADSNVSKMAELWGSSKGSAASTGEPADYERRVVLIQSYLRSDDYRIAADGGEGEGRRAMQVELRRQACTWTVPFTVVKSEKGGWIVSNIDLTRAGNPVRPCDPSARGDSTQSE
jgi:hypothetical protein